MKHRASIVTPSRYSQLIRALSVNVRGAADLMTPTIQRVEIHGDVESIDNGDVIKILVSILVQCEFGQCVGWDTPTLTLESTSAISGLAMALTIAIEVAPGATPNAGHGSAGCNPEIPCLAVVQADTSSWASSGPDSVGTIVDNFKVRCVCQREKRGKDEDGT
ncbi:hypothetical protein PIB30_040382 [Stylosanthes scabra]|uniref:Uncharacterized protein n=1 Tax=Stylosanthes scabra TaxID=79078 RepID=A0ABU6ZD92_9FABA|nr:hypothetical protein [Stylosanthes scabra]